MHYCDNDQEQDVVLARMDDDRHHGPETPAAAQGYCFRRPRVLAEERDRTVRGLRSDRFMCTTDAGLGPIR